MAQLQTKGDSMNNWKKLHGETIVSFMQYLNTQTSDFILKGGTALYLCYNLNRFSEDIDLDGRTKGLVGLVDAYCAENGYSFRIAKSTATVERCFVNYGAVGRPLKIEASYRRTNIPTEETKIINGINVYNIEQLCIMKVGAYAGRDKIRDLYDVTFIYNHYADQLTPQAIALLRGAIEHKGIEQFDYVVQTQPDELIDNDQLASDFLKMYNDLGLLLEAEEQEFLENSYELDDELEP
jgi:predicted nucleotidyltransferase component of viral defense system